MKATIERVDATPAKWHPLQGRLKQMPETELRQYLADRLRMTADNLMEIAMVVRELDERGIDISDLRLSMLVYLWRSYRCQSRSDASIRAACPSCAGICLTARSTRDDGRSWIWKRMRSASFSDPTVCGTSCSRQRI
jgi:hypothetical protein